MEVPKNAQEIEKRMSQEEKAKQERNTEILMLDYLVQESSYGTHFNTNLQTKSQFSRVIASR